MEKVRRNRLLDFLKAFMNDESGQVDLSTVELPRELKASLEKIGKDIGTEDKTKGLKKGLKNEYKVGEGATIDTTNTNDERKPFVRDVR